MGKRRVGPSPFSNGPVPQIGGPGGGDDDFGGGGGRSGRPRGQKKKNRGTKTSVTFDPQKRHDFLTGFKKRKDERRKKAKEQMEQEIKEEIKKAKETVRKTRNATVGSSDSTTPKNASQCIVPEIEHLLPSSVHDMGSHTVSVTHLEDLMKLARPEEKMPGELNKEQQEKNEEDAESHPDGDGDAEAPPTASVPLRKGEMRSLNLAVQRKLQKSKVIKRGNRAQAKKDAKSSKFDRKTAKSKRAKHYHPKKTQA